MATVKVTTQTELDEAISKKVDEIIIDSPAGIWLYVGKEGQLIESRVEAWGSSTVVAWGSSTVVARESSTVEAWGSSRVEAWGSSTVVARESSTVEAWESSTVVAWGSSRVEAWGSSTVVASKFVAIHLHSSRAVVAGGVLIDLTKLDLTSAPDWLDYHGVKVDEEGRALVYKAVNDEWQTTRGKEWTYSPGSTVVAKDFKPTKECGKGLHFGITPRHAKNFYQEATRFVVVKVLADDLIPLEDKCKVASCEVLYEVDIDGEPIVVQKSETQIEIEKLEAKLEELKASGK